MLECVVNISEGRDRSVVDLLAASCGDGLLDVHRDPHHNRSVFTLVGVEAPRRLARAAVEALDIGVHSGVHPRIGIVDVVPFVPLAGSTMDDAIVERDAFAEWAARELAIPCFRYGPERSLPEVRHGAFSTFAPDTGPPAPHPTAGACAVGARGILVAYNVWVDAADVTAVATVAAEVRNRDVRALGLVVGARFQVSCNLITPDSVGPSDITDAVRRIGRAHGVTVTGCELVGLVPQRVLDRIDPTEWTRLDLAADRTIEARLSGR